MLVQAKKPYAVAESTVQLAYGANYSTWKSLHL